MNWIKPKQIGQRYFIVALPKLKRWLPIAMMIACSLTVYWAIRVELYTLALVFGFLCVVTASILVGVVLYWAEMYEDITAQELDELLRKGIPNGSDGHSAHALRTGTAQEGVEQVGAEFSE